MFRFENPEYLYWLVLIPILVLIRFLALGQRRRKLKSFGDIELLKAMMPDADKYRPAVKFWLLQIALALTVIMLARPQMGSKTATQEKRSGIEAIIAIDVSNSMRAQDVAPTRLDKSKMLVENMVEKFTDDKIGLVVFAGDAFVQLPITADYVSAKMFLQGIDPSLMATQGTNIADAIETAAHSFTQQDKVGRAIIVITDGEDHEGGAVEAAAAAKKSGMLVYVLGIGNPNGSPVPDERGGYMKDNAGNVVMSALNEDMCEQIARAGGGTYIHVDNTNTAQKRLDAALSKLEKAEMSTLVYGQYNEQFQAFCIIILLLLAVETCIYESKNPLLKNIKLFKRK